MKKAYKNPLLLDMRVRLTGENMRLLKYVSLAMDKAPSVLVREWVVGKLEQIDEICNSESIKEVVEE